MKVHVKKGEILFFKKGKRTSRPTEPTIEANGYWYGMVLGHVTVGQKDPTNADLLRLIGSTGFISFDDVIEFIGHRRTKSVLRKFEQKYCGAIPPKKWWEFWKIKPAPRLIEKPKDEKA